jgi:hypothetical protein
VRLRVNDAAGHSGETSKYLDVYEATGPTGPSAARKARLGRRRAFSARLNGKSGGIDGTALTGAGSVRAFVSGPTRLTKAERLLKRFLSASWRTRLTVAVDKAARTATVGGLALATAPRHGGRACIRLSIDFRAGGLPTGKFSIVGGTGSGANLYGEASFRFQVRATGPAVVLGNLRAGLGRKHGLPRRCP